MIQEAPIQSPVLAVKRAEEESSANWRDRLAAFNREKESNRLKTFSIRDKEVMIQKQIQRQDHPCYHFKRKLRRKMIDRRKSKSMKLNLNSCSSLKVYKDLWMSTRIRRLKLKKILKTQLSRSRSSLKAKQVKTRPRKEAK